MSGSFGVSYNMPAIAQRERVPCTHRINKLRSTFASGRTRCVSSRVKLLRRLLRRLREKREDIIETIDGDPRKTQIGTVLDEIEAFLEELNDNVSDVQDWVRPELMNDRPLMFFETPYIHSEPLGLCLVFDAWTYPVSLAVTAVISALVAGNAVVLATDFSSETGKVARRLFKHLDSGIFLMLNRVVSSPESILGVNYDHIFFTGCEKITSCISGAAEEQAIPFILEKGGESLAYVDPSADFGKMLIKTHVQGVNGEKPALILCPEEVYDKFLHFSVNTYVESFGLPCVRLSRPWYRSRLTSLNKSVTKLVNGSFEGGAPGSDPEKARRRVCRMRPMLKVQDLAEAIAYINNRGKPLNTFLFAKDTKIIQTFMSGTTADTGSRIIVWD